MHTHILLSCIFSCLHIFSFAQNVGIGLITPASKLHIKGSEDVSQLIIDANSTQSSDNPLIRLRKSDGSPLMIIHSDDYSNCFVGFNAGRFNNVAGGAYYNTFIGSFSGSENTSGDANTGTGWSALRSNITGVGNTAFGFNTLYYSTSSYNTSFGISSLLVNTTGEFNTGLGAFSLQTNTTGSKNTAVGSNADVLTDSLTNATAIGYKAKVGASNALVLGGTGSEAVNVGIGTTTPNASSALDINSTTKGFLPPRMTTFQRDLIVDPAAGLSVWCSNCGVYGQIQVYNGVIWTNMMGGKPFGIPQVGDSDGGGIVAYILQSGDPGYIAGEVHGLIAAPGDNSTILEWGCSGTSIPGADGTAIGTGNQNTIDIVNGCATPGIAARICNDLVLGGYSDWYLPCKDELNKLYLNRAAIGGFASNVYWSSSEYSIDGAWFQDFDDGIPYIYFKNAMAYVRAVRAF